VGYAAVTLCVSSQRVIIIIVVYFVIDSVRNLFDTPLQVLGGKAAAAYRVSVPR